MIPKYRHQIDLLFIETHDSLLAYAKSSLGSYELAEDAVQETFCIACRKPEALLNSKSQMGWLLQTLRYVILNMKHAEVRLEDKSNRLVTNHRYQETYSMDLPVEVLYHDIAKTAEYQLIRDVAGGASTADISNRFGITIETCRKRIYRAKQVLRKYFQSFLLIAFLYEAINHQ